MHKIIMRKNDNCTIYVGGSVYNRKEKEVKVY